MKKTLLLLLAITGTLLATAQKNETKQKTDWSKIDLSDRPADHLMIQYGGDSWTNRPDSVRTGNGFSRHFNIYFMVDKPFKTNKKMSLGLGAGLGTSHMFFKNTRVDLRSPSARLPFTNVDSTDHFEKMKMTTIYLEIPLELRYYSNPQNPAKSWKAAIGLKIGTLLKAYTKGKNYVNKNGQSLYGTSYVEKQSSKRFINGTMMAATARVGYGIFSIDAGYQLNGVLKDGTGPSMRKFSVGITISGL
jgi:Outer membrane protein beta-barrel domain